MSFVASRVMTRSASAIASGPVTRYLYSGLTSMTAAASRIALYSMSWKSAYTEEAKKPAHSRHCIFRLRGAVRGWNAVPTLTGLLLGVTA